MRFGSPDGGPNSDGLYKEVAIWKELKRSKNHEYSQACRKTTQKTAKNVILCTGELQW